MTPDKLSFLITVTTATILIMVLIFGGLAIYIHNYRIKQGWEGLWGE